MRAEYERAECCTHLLPSTFLSSLTLVSDVRTRLLCNLLREKPLSSIIDEIKAVAGHPLVEVSLHFKYLIYKVIKLYIKKK